MSEHLLHIAREGLLLALLLAAPPMLSGALAGAVSAALQGATRIQEPTLTLAARVVAVSAALLLSGPWIAAQWGRFATSLWSLLPALAR